VNNAQAALSRMLAPMARRLRLMVGRAVITAIADAGKVQSAQVKLLDGEVRDGVEILHQYGFTSIAHGQMEGLYFSVGGDRDHGVLICVADRQYRLKSIAPGEVAIYDDLDQKIHLTRDGIVIDGAGLPISVRNTPLFSVQADQILLEANGITGRATGGTISMESDLLANTGEIKDRSATDGKTMEEMRNTHNVHTHPENDAGGPTDPPLEQM